MLNVTDLAPYGADEPILRTESLQEGGDDVDSPSCPSGSTYNAIKLPTKGHPPWSRSFIKNSREEFNQPVEPMTTLLDHEELKPRLLQEEIIREAPNEASEAHGQLNSASTSYEDCISLSKQASSKPQAAKDEEGFESNTSLLPKTTKIPMLPVLEGTRDFKYFA